MVSKGTKKSHPSKGRNQSFELTDILYPQSSPARLVTIVVMAVLVWMALRLWWSFYPHIMLPLIMGLLLSTSLRRSDMLVVSAASSVLATFLFPLKVLDASSVIITSIIIMTAVPMLVLTFTNDNWRRIAPYLVLAIILTGFFAHAYDSQRTLNDNGYSLVDQLNFNPPLEAYAFDAFIYTKTFYLMEEGKGYYNAFKEADIGDKRIDSVPTSVLGWRLPTVFYAWHLLFSNGSQIGIGFLFLTIIIALLAYFLARQLSDAGFAVISAALICSYYFYGANSIWIVFVEYWSLLIAFIAALFFVRGQTYISVVFAMLAPLFRELYIFTIAAGFIGELVNKNFKRALAWVASGFVLIAIYSLHYLKVKSLVPAVDTSAGWLTGGGWKLVQDSMSFSANYLVESPNASIMIYALGLLGLISVKPLRNKVFLLFLAVIPPIIFKFVGNQWSYYWGVSFMPFVFIGFAPGLKALENLLKQAIKQQDIKADVEMVH